MDLPDGVIYYRLKQVDFDGSTDYSNTIAIRNSKDSDVLFYPNPSTGLINIELKEDIDIVILTITGQEIANYHFTSNSSNIIDISKQPKGIYFMIYYKNQQRIVEKLIIQ